MESLLLMQHETSLDRRPTTHRACSCSGAAHLRPPSAPAPLGALAQGRLLANGVISAGLPAATQAQQRAPKPPPAATFPKIAATERPNALRDTLA